MAQVVSDCLYRGERRKTGTSVVVHDAPGENHALGAGDGYDWGRPTPGAQALAATLLRDAIGAPAAADLEERFFLEVVCQLSFMEPWVMWRRDIQAWVDGEGRT